MSAGRRFVLLAGLVLGAAALLLPDAALAHGLVGRTDLPIPRWLFGWGAAAVLVVSFVGLAVLWPQPRFEHPTERRVLSLPRFVEPLCGAIGLALFVVVVYAGLAGSQTPTNNIAPTFVYVAFWVGLVPLSVIFGDVFAAFNPWRAVARAVAWGAARVSPGGLPAALPYPARLGRWPAAIGIFAFAWVELVYAGRDDPSALAVLALAYAAAQFVGMSLYGIDPWTRRGDAFSVYFGLIARIAPLRWERGVVYRRRPLSGLTTLDVVPGTVALLAAMIGSTSFDGFSQGDTWNSISSELTPLFHDLGFGQENALEASFTVGLLGAVLAIGLLYRLGVAGMRFAGARMDARELAGAFVHSLVPIAVAYVAAHYFSFLAYQGQAIGYLASDPLGRGSDLLGTADATIDYGWITATAIWYVQVAALVVGHVAALVLAHDRALVLFRDPRLATRSQYWMLTVMIAFTSLALWLLSEASA